MPNEARAIKSQNPGFHLDNDYKATSHCVCTTTAFVVTNLLIPPGKDLTHHLL